MEEKPKGVPYEGPSGAFRKSPWLSAEDLPDGKDVDVVIVNVMRYEEVKFDAGRTEKNVGTLVFKGKERELIINAGKRKVLGNMFGKIAKNWKGKTITLYVGQTRFGKETVDCINIRDRGSRPATASEQFLMDERTEQDSEPTASGGAGVANGSELDDPAERERLLREDDGGGDRGTDLELTS